MGGFHLFTLADIPVRISPWYLFLLAFLTVRGNPASALLYALCITISLLVHELGHAFVARHYKLQPHILLHGFGGLTGHESARSPRQEALIVAAGPGAGLLLGAASLLALNYLQIESRGLYELLLQLMYINFFWSFFNLLPMWPMDGGQLLRLGASKVFKPARGERITHIVSLVTVGLIAVGGYFLAAQLFSGPFMLMILAMTAWQNVQALSENNSASTPRRDNPFARELLTQAEAAYAAGNDDEAARLSHQLRSESNVPPQLMARAWAILGVTSTRKGDYKEALSYLKRAPDLPDVVEATAQCFYQLEMYDALEALVSTRAFSRLPSQTRETILGALRDMSPATR